MAKLLKFKEGIPPTDIDRVRTNLPSKIPAISSIKAGQKIKHPLDHDFDEGVIFVFKDEDTLKDCRQHGIQGICSALRSRSVERSLLDSGEIQIRSYSIFTLKSEESIRES